MGKQEREQGNGEPEVVAAIQIVETADGNLRVQGPLEDSRKMLELLARAHAQYVITMSHEQLRQRMEEAQKQPHIYTPDGVRI